MMKGARAMHDVFDPLRKKLIQEISAYYGGDETRVDHAQKVLTYAEKLLREEQADPYVVIPAALMYDVGAGTKDAPSVVGKILVEMEYEDSNIYEICAIIARRTAPRAMEDTNFKVVHDAAVLAARDDARGTEEAGTGTLMTDSGRRMAETM
jgi:HD superfamily phosphodiesterase